MKWQSYKLKEVGEVVTGNTPPTTQREYYGTQYKFIKPTDMREGQRYVPITEECYSELAYQKYRKSLLPVNTPCVVTIGSLGKKMCLTDEPSFTNQAVNAVIPNENFDGVFLYYCLRTRLPYVKQLDSGTTSGRENVSKSSFSNIVIEAPSLAIQKKIASILSAYDNLIENNNKRIKILEQMAENLYKEWFVRFRFPGHETTPFENGIPKGWKIEEIKNISTVTDGVHNTIQDTPNSQYLLLSCKNIKDGKLQIGDDERTIDEETFLKLRKRTLLAKGDVLVTSVGTIGDVLLLNQEPSHIEFQRSVAIIKPNKKFVNSSFLYEMLKSMRKEFENAAHGAAQQCLFIGDINRMKICLPPLETCLFFEKKVQKIYDLILTLTNQSDNLIKQRDLLLPRLMSGKLAV